VSDATVDVGRAQRRTAAAVADWPSLDADRDLPALCEAALRAVAEAGIPQA
jgi:hypothetical protein